MANALDAGGEILAGGGRPASSGFYMNPAFVGGLPNDSEIAQTELFGPVGVVLRYTTLEEAVAIAKPVRTASTPPSGGPRPRR